MPKQGTSMNHDQALFYICAVATIVMLCDVLLWRV